jgi:hypothetical protein
MSPNASKLLLAVWRRHNGSNNGEISFSVREAEAIGFSKDQTSRAFKELVSKGFLKVRTDSAFTCKLRLARTWEITAEACDDRPPSKDFMRWQADGERKPGGET